MIGDLPRQERVRQGWVTIGVGIAWGGSAIAAGAGSAYFNEWMFYRFVQRSLESASGSGSYGPPSWAMGLQGFAVLLFPLSVWWLVLAVASGRDHQRGRARYWYVGSVVVLITLAVSDIFVRTSIPIDEPFDHLASPRFVDDVALAMIGLVAVAITVWFARGPRMRNARGVDGPSLAAEPVNRANN